MPEYLAPGVFIEETERGSKPIAGVATSTAAFLGVTARGSTRPRMVTSFAEFLRFFGDAFDDEMYMPHAVRAFFDNGGRRCYICRITPADGTRAQTKFGNIVVRALGTGAGGNRISVRLTPGNDRDADGNPTGFNLQVYYWDRITPADMFDPVAFPSQSPRPSLVEEFEDLSSDPNSPKYYRKVINNFDGSQIREGGSALIEISLPDNEPPPAVGTSSLQPLLDGQDSTSNSAVGRGDFEGNDPDPDNRKGWRALELDEYDEVALIYAPDADEVVGGDLIAHCERKQYRFAVLDAAEGQVDPTVDVRRTTHDSGYAAYYYPWITVADSRSGARRNLPPGGFVCGIYARSDIQRGVWKAPANEIVTGAVDLEFDIDQRKQEDLNPRGINVIRRLPGRGIRVWGARTISSDPQWRYVNVRRLLIFLEASIYRGMQWVVFEPNDQRLWARVKQTLTAFLRTQWRAGALMGAKEEEAFSVSVGRETMTEDDILNGRLIIEVGIAPVRPAEFIIFRIFQKTQEASN